MNGRFKRKLHDVLIKDDISVECGIVNDLLFQMMGIELPNERYGGYNEPGLNIKDDYYNRDDNVKFNIPNVKMSELFKLLTFLKFPWEEYVANKPVKLKEEFVFGELLTRFNNCYEDLKKNNSRKFYYYYVASKGILESTAINTLSKYNNEALDICANIKEPTPVIAKIEKYIASLNGFLERLKSQPILYKNILALEDKFLALQQLSETQQYPELIKNLKLVNEGFGLFKKYHRFESVIMARKFKQEMENFLNNQLISDHTCDVVEDTLLLLANASLGPKGSAHFGIASDPSRVLFEFQDMDKGNADKIIEYLNTHGDITAIEGKGYRKYGGCLPASASLSEGACLSSVAMHSTPKEKELESHTIEVDGKALYESIFPQIRGQIEKMIADNSEVIEKYRQASKDHLEELNKTKHDPKLFAVKTAAPVVAEEKPELVATATPTCTK